MSKYGKESEVKIFSTRSGLPMWTMQVFRLCLFELTVWLQKFVFNALKCESYRGTAASNETVGVEYGEQSFGHNIFAISLLSGINNNNNNDGDNKNRHKLHSKISTIEMKLSKTTLSASIKKRMQLSSNKKYKAKQKCDDATCFTHGMNRHRDRLFVELCNKMKRNKLLKNWVQWQQTVNMIFPTTTTKTYFWMLCRSFPRWLSYNYIFGGLCVYIFYVWLCIALYKHFEVLKVNFFEIPFLCAACCWNLMKKLSVFTATFFPSHMGEAKKNNHERHALYRHISTR